MVIIGQCTSGPPGDFFFVEPTHPDFSAQAPNGYVIGSNISIAYYAFQAKKNNFNTPFTGKLIPFDAINVKTGITLFENHVFSKDDYTDPSESCEKWILKITRTIPNNTLKVLKPSYNSLKIVIWNVTDAEANPNTTDLYHFSPGIYLSDPNEGETISASPVIIPGIDELGTGAVIPPNGREIAKHGAVGIGTGLGVIFIALFSQWLYLKPRKTKGRKYERGTWQERMGLTSQSSSREGSAALPPKSPSAFQRPMSSEAALTASSGYYQIPGSDCSGGE